MRKISFVFALVLFATTLVAQQSLDNDSVTKLSKAGMSDDLIVATINASPGTYDISANGLISLKNSGASEKVLSAIIARATVPAPTAKSATTDDLTAAYKRYRNSVVTVLAEYGPAKGTGFVVDSTGLVMTNQHVVGKSEWVAVQVDEKTRLSAKILAADPEKDVAVLWVNLANAPPIEPVAFVNSGDIPAEEGEKVFTIGSPLSQSKILTTGIVSKVEARAIISDVNINPGNSGGPLFNSQGKVIGITTFGEKEGRVGPGIAGIVRIDQALPLLETAKKQMSGGALPSGKPLPIEPSSGFPIDALKNAAYEKKFKSDPYVFSVGDYDMAVITPILQYRKLSSRVEAANTKNKRNQKSETAAKGTFEPLDDLRGWEEYTGEYQPVLFIQASPKLVEGFWSALGGAWRLRTGTFKGQRTCTSKPISTECN